MRFYTENHKHYCGIDLHAKTMYLCILDQEGKILLHRNMKSRPEDFLQALMPFREDLVRQFKDRWATLREKLGITLDDLRGVAAGELAAAIETVAKAT